MIESMKARTKASDAVAKATEGITPEQPIARFGRTAVRGRFDEALRRAETVSKPGIKVNNQ